VPAVWSALLWGAGSAATFPAGALVGLHFSMSHTHLGLLMAFGAGTLIFAVSVELFGELLDRVRGGRAHLLDVGIEFGAAILGALLYMQMNQFMLWWQSQANHWRQLRSRGIMSLGKAVMQVSERVGMRLNPHLPADVQTEVLRTLFQCFMGQHSEGVTPAELVEVLDALGHPTTLEEVEVMAEESCAYNHIITFQEFQFMINHYIQLHQAAAQGHAHATDGAATSPERVKPPASQDEEPEAAHKRAHDPQCSDSAALLPSSSCSSAPAAAAAVAEAELVEVELVERGARGAVRDGRRESVTRLGLARGQRAWLSLLDMDGVDSTVLSIWLGVAMDGLPEAVLIGLLAMQNRMSFPFIASVFISNFPEAMSCAAMSKRQGMRPHWVMLMWTSLCVMTGVVAMLTAAFFTVDKIRDGSAAFYHIKEVSEGLSAGAMLTCVAAAMIPEAITTGGQMAGFVLVIGFLAATGIKVLELMYYEQKQ